MGDIKPMKTNDIDNLLQKFAGGYTFNRRYWPYVMEMSFNDYDSAERFCYTHFKSRNWRSQGPYFGFKRKEDYEWFVLRWS